MNYQEWIKNELRTATGKPVYGRAAPTGEETPEGTTIYTVFKSPTHVMRDQGIVSARHDIHMVMFMVRVAGPDEDDVLGTMDTVWRTLTGAYPPDGGEITSVVGETWGVLDGKARPQEYNEAISFIFPTNLSGM